MNNVMYAILGENTDLRQSPAKIIGLVQLNDKVRKYKTNGWIVFMLIKKFAYRLPAGRKFLELVKEAREFSQQIIEKSNVSFC